MKRTNEQVKKALNRFININDESKFYDALTNYWIKYNLTDEQVEMLEHLKKEYRNDLFLLED